MARPPSVPRRQRLGGFGDEHVLAHEKMEHLALSKTYNTNAQTPDSAATATALNTGVKTKSGFLNIGEQARVSPASLSALPPPRDGCVACAPLRPPLRPPWNPACAFPLPLPGVAEQTPFLY